MSNLSFQQKKEVERLAQNTPSLKDLKGLGYDKNGNLKKGFAILKSGKVVSIKQLNVLFEEVKA